MKFTYANVMSTIAMFAAVTTGSSYAAATLGKDSVRSREIKNGQVTLADLNPTVRARLNRTATTGTTTPAPTGSLLPVGVWTNTDTLAVADGTTNLAAQVGTTGRVQFRLVGTITKPSGGADVSISFKTASGAGVAGFGASSPTAAGTYDASALAYVGTGDLDDDPTDAVFTVAAGNAQTVVATHSAATGGLRAMTLQVRRL